ncbi:ABC transporter ATP-binding protein [Xylanimonas protaetiae]|uniref:ABC transporter ATP-binding protein n=1 Tax=Xylanimonas protaetiae TaxID=2509457 RepID=A0A4P6F2Q2_9MICO|nr:ABC transporter ATP-binding protein [Xylanimonas protaetiae]QAY69842.1 ABC transporter ATP-binding protein [Xylanimonas protaetiae]
MDPARGRHSQPDAPAEQPPAQASARDLVKTYGSGETEVRALDGVSVDFAQGRLTAIMGPSGSGKSTLMHCMAGLDTPTSGTVVVDGVEISSMSQRALTRLRRTRVGFVFQAYNLVPTLTAEENITLPLDIARAPVDREWFDAVVDAVGMRARLHHRPNALSGGEQQRVACARALVSRPSVVFADEPTGNLDSKSSREVLTFLRQSVDELGQTVVMVTHDPRAAAYAHRVLLLGDGRITADLANPGREEILAAVGAEDDDEPRPATGRYAAVPAPATGPLAVVGDPLGVVRGPSRARRARDAGEPPA